MYSKWAWSYRTDTKPKWPVLYMHYEHCNWPQKAKQVNYQLNKLTSLLILQTWYTRAEFKQFFFPTNITLVARWDPTKKAACETRAPGKFEGSTNHTLDYRLKQTHLQFCYSVSWCQPKEGNRKKNFLNTITSPFIITVVCTSDGTISLGQNETSVKAC